MARKDKFETDDFGFGDNGSLDIPDFDFDAAPVKDDRKATTKMAGAVATGIKDTVKSPEFIRKMVKNSLPRGYGTAVDFADQTAGTLGNLYNSTVKEIKPVINDLKRTTKRVLPMTGKFLPKSVAERLNKWAEPDDKKYATISAEQQRESALQAQLGDIFKYQAETQAKNEAEGEVKDRIKEAIDQSRHRDSLGQMNAMRISLQRLTDYQDKIDVNYQRKSLELQFRHYYVAVDSLEEQKRMSAVFTQNLEGILKNTGLPEFAKLKDSERISEVMRNKFANALNDSVFDKRRGFMRNVGEKISGAVKERVGGFVENIKTGMGMANDVMDQKQMLDEMGPMPGMTATDIGGGMVGSMAANSFGEWLGKQIKKRTSKHQKTIDLGMKGLYEIENMPQTALEWSKGYQHEDIPVIGQLVGLLKDAIRATDGQDTTIQSDKIGNMQNPDIFGRQTNKSITEIIPGFLARIHRELAIIRTGNPNTELLTYDFNSNKFVDKATATKNVLGKLFSANDRRSTQEEIAALVKKVEEGSGMTLNEEQRKALGKHLLNDSQNNKKGDKNRLSNYDAFSTRESGKHADVFSRLFQEYFKDDSGTKQREFALEYNNLGRSMSDSRKLIQDIVNVGGREILEEIGLLEPGKDSIQMEKVRDYFTNNEAFAGAAPNQSTRPAPRRLLKSGKNVDRKMGGDIDIDRVANARPVSEPAAENYQPQSVTVNNDDLIKAVKENSPKTAAETASETLLRIEKQIQEGIHVVSHQPGEGSLGAPMGPDGRRWWDKSIKENASYLLGKGREGLDRMTTFAKGLPDRLTQAKDKLKDKFGELKDKLQDVWLEHEMKARLEGWKLEAGLYRDAVTGDVIRKWKDIKNGVIDENGNPVLSIEDAQKAFVKTKLGNKLITAFGVAKEKAKDLFNKGVAKIGGVYGSALKLGKDLALKAKGWLYQPQDIYVKGKPEKPVLLAITMKANGYRSRINYHYITEPSKIDGPVINDQGNVVLTEEDLKDGLVDAEGKPIRSGLKKITGFISDMYKSGKAKLKKGWDVVSKGAQGLWDKAKGMYDKKFGGEKEKGEDGGLRSIVKRLTEIRNLLNDRLPAKKKHIIGDVDGDGVREGSALDLMSKLKGKKKSKEEEVKAKKEGDPKAKGKGILETVKDAGKSAWGGIQAIKDVALAGAGLFGVGSAAAGTAAAGTAAATTAAATTGAAAAGGGLLAGAGTALGAVGAVLGSPVVLGALALAAVGAGAYYGYKYLTKKRLGTLSKVRYAQYGFLPTDTDHLQQVFGLEDELMPGISYGKDGATLDEKKVDVKKISDLFGVDVKDPGAVESFLKWLQNRFKPVFLTHLTALHSVSPEKGLGDVDGSDWSVEEKKKYLNLVKFPDGPYSFFLSPFKTRDPLAAGAPEVKIQIEAAEAQLAKEGKGDEKGEKKEGVAAGVATAATVAATATATAITPVNEVSDETQSSKLTNITPKLDAAGLTDTGAVITVVGGAPGVRKASGRLNALACIRFKAYGLKEMDTDKVQALMCLEEEVAKGLSFTKDRASWSGSAEKILSAFGASFNVDGVRNSNAYSWLSWFNLRFLPVYLAYASALYVITGKNNVTQAEGALKAQEEVDVATAIYTAKSEYSGNGMSVWQVPATPWPGYELNTDVKSIDDNMQLLKDTAKSAPLPEAVGVKTKNGVEGNAPTTAATAATVAGQVAKSSAEGDKSKGFFASLGDKISSTASSMWKSVKDVASTAAGTVAGVFGGGASGGGAEAITHPGKGTGGDVNSLPMPQGNSSWASMKNLILGAAKMAGVDGKLMATMAAIESGFNATVKAGTSSARGLYQFIEETWNTMLSKYGSKYGIAPNASPLDPRANALMGAEFIKENTQALSKVLKRPLTDTDLYFAHFLGAGGAAKFLTADPSAIAAQVLPKAAAANKGIFYGKGDTPLTVAEVYNLVNSRVRNKGKEFGIDVTGSDTMVAKAATAGSAAGAAGTTGGNGAGDLAGPATSATPAAGAQTTNPIGNFPVSDQTPGVAPKATAPVPAAVAPAASAPSASGSGVDSGISALASGFQSPRSRSIMAQQQYQKEGMSEVLGSVDTTLQKSLGVQTDQLEVLKNILKIMVRGSENKAGVKQMSAEDEASLRAPTFTKPKLMPTPPVSMAKG